MVVRGLSRSLARVDVWKAKWAPWLVVTGRSRCFNFPFSYKKQFISCVNTQDSSLFSFFGVFLSVYTFVLLRDLTVQPADGPLRSGETRANMFVQLKKEKKMTYLISLPYSYVKKNALWAMGNIRTRTLALNKQSFGFTLVAKRSSTREERKKWRSTSCCFATACACLCVHACVTLDLIKDPIVPLWQFPMFCVRKVFA